MTFHLYKQTDGNFRIIKFLVEPKSRLYETEVTNGIPKDCEAVMAPQPVGDLINFSYDVKFVETSQTLTER